MNRLRELRKSKKYTLDDIEKQTGINRGTYNNYESGKTSPKPKTWQALANFFNVSVDYLKGYMICSRCGGVFIPESGTAREEIKCCPYCMNPYFVGDSYE